MNPGIMFEFKPNLRIATRDLDRFAGDIRSFREPLQRSIRQVLAPSFRKNFDVGGRPPWEPLQEKSLERRKRAGTTQMLVDTGALRRTAGQLNIWSVSTNDARLDGLPASVGYGTAHQFG